METVLLPKYQKETRANFYSRANNDKEIYESLGTLSDKHLSSLSQVIQKTGEVEVPRPVADLLRELEPKLSSIRPNRLQHILDTSILIREAQKLDLIDDKNLPKLIPDFPIGLFDAKRVAEKVGLLLKLNDRIDQMKGLGILDDQQVKTLKKNMGAQAEETTYLYRQKSSLNKLVYLAAEAKQRSESFGPEQVTQYITTKDMLNQDVKDQQIGTLDNTRINKFLRNFSGEQSVPFWIGRLGEKILDKWSKQEDHSDLVSQGMKLRGLPPLKTPPGKAQ
jgi:hypothetical protein